MLKIQETSWDILKSIMETKSKSFWIIKKSF